MDIALVTANLATSVVFFHSLLTVRNYYVFRRDAATRENKRDGADAGADASGNM